MTKQLFAFADRRLVGVLEDANGIWSFTYDESWLSAADAFPLSPTFALRKEPYVDDSTNRPVQWFFDNLLPEEAMRTALAKEARLAEADAWGLLAYFGRESAGALTLLAHNRSEAEGALLPLPFAELERRIQAMPQQALSATAPKRMSAAGAQQKLLVVLRGEAPNFELFEPVGAEPSMHLLKPSMRSTGFPHSAINEFFCMRLASALGLSVPRVYFLRVPSTCYVVERFDRDTSVSPATRLHCVDAVQLLNYDRSFKYVRANAEELKSLVEKTTTRAATRLALYRWTIFNVLIGNGDAHLKNLSFFVDERGYRLAPFYDLLSTVVYNTPTYREGPGDYWPRCELTMPLGSAHLFSEVNRQALIQFGTDLGLNASNAAKQLDELLFRIEKATEAVYTAVVTETQPDAGEQRLLNTIRQLPLREMAAKLRK